jgi:ribosome-binding protein aMBF1 (putative translation factor)
MNGPQDLDPLEGDRDPLLGETCVLCGGALGGDAEDVTMEDGSVVSLCAQCAGDEIADQASVVSSRSLDDEDVTPAGRARALIVHVIHQRTREHSLLDELGAIVDDLQSQLAAAQLTTFEQDERIRSLTAELDRMSERVRRAEELPVAASGRPGVVADGECVAPQLPDPAPQVHAGVSDLTPDDIYAVQRVFNESMYIEKMRSVRRGLGKPIVNIAKVAGPDRRALLTVAWDIVWYQYFIGLSDDPEAEDATLFAEGMELSELSDHFKQANAMIDDHGRLDASELALSLERDHPANEANLDDDEEQNLEDATEEIWDSTSMPEFRWDD